MSELNEFIADEVEIGKRVDTGVFTVHGERAREQLAESVPTQLTAPWVIVALFRSAFKLANCTEADSVRHSWGVFDCQSNLLRNNSPRTYALRFRSAQPLKVLRKTIEEVIAGPFAGTGEKQLCFSRAILALIKANWGAVVLFSDSSAPLNLDSSDSLMKNFCADAMRRAKTQEVIIVFDRHPELRESAKSQFKRGPFLGLQSQFEQRASHQEPKVLGLFPIKQSGWSNAPSRVVASHCLRYGEIGTWFDYRTSKAALLEWVIFSGRKTPIPIYCEPGEELQRPGQDMSSWDRFRSEGENLILRRWSSPVEQPELRFGRGVFSVMLSDKPSQVAFVNWGNTLETTPIPNCPPGMAACVHWPELKQSLYGESWVKDEQFEQAMHWTEEQAKLAFEHLREQFDYVWDMLRRDHIRKSYRSEVYRRLETWLSL